MHMPLVLTNRRRRGGSASAPAFSPSTLFSSTAIGIWIDPSDLPTMFSDRAGTTPVTTPGTVVGLRLDKSKGLVLGAEKVTNGDFSGGGTGWTLGTGISVTGDALVFSSAPVFSVALNTATTYVAGRTYRVDFTVSNATAGGLAVQLSNGNSAPSVTYEYAIPLTNGTKTLYLTATGQTTFRMYNTSAGASFTIDNISVRELAGNHAVAPTDAARPTYGIEPKGGRRNLLTWSEGFDNAYWVKTGLQAFGSGSISNATTAPDGTLTADFICENSASGNHRVNSPGISYVAGTSLTATVRVKSTTRNYSPYIGNASGAVTATFNLSNGTVSVAASNVGTASGATATITQDAQGFWLCTLSGVVSASSSTDASIFHQIVNGTSASYTGDGASGILIWGAQLELGSTATAYQRVTTAYDVTESGVATCHYVQYDGSDDSMSTAAIDFTATDKMSVFAGVRKLSDAAAGMLLELSANAAGNAGSFYFDAPEDLNNRYLSIGRGSAAASSAQASTTGTTGAAPDSAVISITHDIAGDLSTIRRNAVAGTSATADKGTGNFGNYPLFIGRRNNATLPFNGKDYGIIVVGKTASSTEITDTETWLAAKTAQVTL